MLITYFKVILLSTGDFQWNFSHEGVNIRFTFETFPIAYPMGLIYSRRFTIQFNNIHVGIIYHTHGSVMGFETTIETDKDGPASTTSVGDGDR